MAVQVAEVENTREDERRPLMTTGNMAWMNLGFFGTAPLLPSSQPGIRRRCR
jgi:hypothetical protein